MLIRVCVACAVCIKYLYSFCFAIFSVSHHIASKIASAPIVNYTHIWLVVLCLSVCPLAWLSLSVYVRMRMFDVNSVSIYRLYSMCTVYAWYTSICRAATCNCMRIVRFITSAAIAFGAVVVASAVAIVTASRSMLWSSLVLVLFVWIRSFFQKPNVALWYLRILHACNDLLRQQIYRSKKSNE